MTTDEALVRALRDGDDHALATLYERHRHALYAYSARMLGRAEEARDVVQDVFADLHARRATLPVLRSVQAWLFTIARHRCLNALRAQRDHARLAPRPADVAHADASAPVLAGEEVALVRRALAALPDDLREALVLREYLDLPYAEIAAITECSESAVKSRLFRARQQLFERLHPVLHEGEAS